MLNNTQAVQDNPFWLVKYDIKSKSINQLCQQYLLIGPDDLLLSLYSFGGNLNPTGSALF